ncbi:LysR family transcriptional regulator [Frankia sp. AiPa1]|uniref:LysR family transcriptional regulator n=1 Tax=Frankia sp. AiPa1 TaxID=573492 RepID=UPI00202B2912|nr:LysR family transcriptional regulator [Frankia sp. AiPa1]MCL9761285.1 LysR family transcriptional regulator [Frankia sp. AiPa1]
MRIEQLECLAAIVRLGSMRAASESLHMSQPALSETIRNLERELGLTLLDRRRTGATISATGAELLPHITEVLEAVDRLRAAADDQHRSSQMVRVGTVNAATVPLLAPALREFRAAQPNTQVEVVNTQQADIHRQLLDGGLDLGLVNLMEGDDVAPDLETVELVRGAAVLCCRADSPLAARDSIRPRDLLTEPFIAMRAGYVMHRYVHRLLRDANPALSYSTDGAEMGKLMVAQGLGVTVFPDYSVVGDPLEQCGLITYRPLESDDATVLLVLQRRRTRRLPVAVRRLEQILITLAADYRTRRSRQAG